MEEYQLLRQIKRKYGCPVDSTRYALNMSVRFPEATESEIAQYRKTILASLEKYACAQQHISFWERIPWVQAVFITGSVASLNAKLDDDIDFWVIVDHRRLWLTRFTEWCYFQLRGIRRLPQTRNMKNTFCINYYKTTKQLALQTKNESFAMQFVDAIPLYVRSWSIIATLVRENAWVQQFFPSWYAKQLDSWRLIPTMAPQVRHRSKILDVFEYCFGIVQASLLFRTLVWKPEQIFRNECRIWPEELQKK